VLAVLALVAVGCSTSSAADASPVATTTVDLPKSYRFAPAAISVTAGDTVTWTNSEEIMPHDVTSGAPGQPDAGQLFGSEILMPGQSFTATFPEPGEFVYLCKLHPTMTGVVIVLPS